MVLTLDIAVEKVYLFSPFRKNHYCNEISQSIFKPRFSFHFHGLLLLLSVIFTLLGRGRGDNADSTLIPRCDVDTTLIQCSFTVLCLKKYSLLLLYRCKKSPVLHSRSCI